MVQGVKHNNVINKNVVELPFINNNTFVGYLHSKGVVQHFHLNLLGNKHLYQLQRWYDMAPPNWAPIFLRLVFLQYPQLSLVLSLQVLMASTSHLCHTTVWASVDDMLTKPWQFPFALQSNPGSFLMGCHCCLERTSSFSALEIQSLEESQPWTHKSLKMVFP